MSLVEKRKVPFGQRLHNAMKILRSLWSPISHLCVGLWERRVPPFVFYSCYGIALVIFFDIHIWILEEIHMRWMAHFFIHHWYMHFYIALAMPFLLWGVRQALDEMRLRAIMERDFTETGLKTNMGRMPKLVSIRSVDDTTNCMTLQLNGLTASEIKTKSDALAQRMSIFISQVQEDRPKGQVKLFYTNEPLPDCMALTNPEQYKNFSILVGFGAGKKPLRISLLDVPHLLVGGTTQMGKSTFFRQAITTLYLGNRSGIKITYIDLKTGMEAKVFEGVEHVRTIADTPTAVVALTGAQTELKERAELLAKNSCTSVAEFNAKPSEKRVSHGNLNGAVNLKRHVIFIDEAAELFLVGKESRAKEASDAKRICKTLVAQGRAVGIHVVIGTQRPDANTIDMGIKGNLPGRLCFFASDNASSMVILDAVRAADLSHEQKGRAIWRNGPELQEIQTPNLTVLETEELIKKFKKPAEVARSEVQSAPQKSLLALDPDPTGDSDGEE